MMSNAIDQAVLAFLQDPTDEQNAKLDRVILEGEFLVPVSGQAVQSGLRNSQVSVRCVEIDKGVGALPAFTDVKHLLAWKPEGCEYVLLAGRKLIAMAVGMPSISLIAFNLADEPRGMIPRSDFARMMSI
jgi:hypothetical protein